MSPSRASIRVEIGEKAERIIAEDRDLLYRLIGRCLSGDRGELDRIEQSGDIDLLADETGRRLVVWHAARQLIQRGVACGLYALPSGEHLWVLHRIRRKKKSRHRSQACVWTSEDLMASLSRAHDEAERSGA